MPMLKHSEGSKSVKTQAAGAEMGVWADKQNGGGSISDDKEGLGYVEDRRRREIPWIICVSPGRVQRRRHTHHTSVNQAARCSGV